MLSIENLRNAQNFIEQAKGVAKQVHDMIVVENTTVGSQLLNTLADADGRAAAAYTVLECLDEIEANGATELDKETATTLLAMLKQRLQNSIYGRLHEQTTWMLNDYVRWLEGAIATME